MVKNSKSQFKKEDNPITKSVDAVRNIISGGTHPLLSQKLTIAQKSADLLTKAMGSWAFIILFITIMSLWIATNVYGWVNQWDPYPFILLNLALSCLAAIQAPIILMSQNRESQKDRIRSEYDYAVNRKVAREIEEMKKQLNRIEKKI